MTDLLTLFDIDNPPLKPKRRPPIKSTPQLVTRFMSKVYVEYGMPDGCWIWTGTLQVEENTYKNPISGWRTCRICRYTYSLKDNRP
jgi:hypothetical protein